MSEELEQLCKDYLADNLPPRRRKQVEQRIANGDAELISTINRLRSFQKPTSGSQHHPNLGDEDPSLLGAFMNQEKESGKDSTQKTDSSAQEGKQKPSSSKQRKNPPFSEYTDEPKESTSRLRLLQIAGGLIIVLLLFFIYYQWQNQLLERELKVQTEQLDNVSQTLEALQRADRRSARQFEMLKTIIRSDLHERISLDIEHPHWKSGLMIWDRSTLRTAWLINDANLPSDSAFYVWTADKDANWRYAGSVDYIQRDSLYTNWDNTAFNQARRLQIRVDSIYATSSPKNHRHGSLVGTISMPR